MLDALCETEDVKEFNVEVQKADEDDGSDVSELIVLWGFRRNFVYME